MLVLNAYKDKGWLNLTNTISMETISKALSKKSYSTLTEVENAYNAYRENYVYIDTSGGGSSGGGSSSGKGSSGGVTMYAPDNREETQIKENNVLFSDVELTMWAAEAIEKTVKAGILSGMGDGTFAPYGNLTRAQAAVILTKLAGLELNDTDFGFSDVNSSDWYYKYVGATCNAGIFYGMNESFFGAAETLNREQAAVIFWRYMNNNGFEKKESDVVFDDSDEISEWAREAVASLMKYKVIAGKTDKLFAPDKPLLRAEAAIIISRILELNN